LIKCLGFDLLVVLGLQSSTYIRKIYIWDIAWLYKDFFLKSRVIVKHIEVI